MIKISLRPARIEDLPTLYEFEQGIVSAERPFDPTLSPGHINYYDLKEYIDRPDVEVIVAEVDGELAGSGYVKIKEAQPYLSFDSYAYVGFMYVKPNHRRKGISHKIIGELVSWSKSKGLNEIRLDVYDQNDIAVAAYENIGFNKHLVEMRKKI